MPINSLRAVIYTQNQSNHLCIPLCTTAESRVHPALLIVALNAVLAKLLPSHLLMQWLKGLTPLCTALILNQGSVCIVMFFHTQYRQMGDRLLLSHPTPLAYRLRKAGLAQPVPGASLQHCYATVVAWPTFESCKHRTGFTATSAEKGITSESKKKKEHHSFACASSKFKFRTDCLPLLAGKEKISRGLSSTD